MDTKMKIAEKLSESVGQAMEEMAPVAGEGSLASLAWAVGGLSHAMVTKPQDEVIIWGGRVIAAATVCVVEGDSTLNDLRSEALSRLHPAETIKTPDEIDFDDVADKFDEILDEVSRNSTPGTDT